MPIGEVSEPVETQFGVHLLEVLERDDARPKDQATIDQGAQSGLRRLASGTDHRHRHHAATTWSRVSRDLDVSPVLFGGFGGSTPADATGATVT
ncbi:MAG: hypothetical protein R3A10_05310 [Caldilineaceae bacterium]